MRTEVETVYICDYCNQSYAMEEDCRSCERTCAVLKPIVDACPGTEDIFDAMSSTRKFEMSAAVAEAVKRSLGLATEAADDQSATAALDPPESL